MFLVVLDAIVVDAYRRASFVAFPAALLSLLSLALLLRIKTSDPRANVAEKRKAGRPITCVESLATCELVDRLKKANLVRIDLEKPVRYGARD